MNRPTYYYDAILEKLAASDRYLTEAMQMMTTDTKAFSEAFPHSHQAICELRAMKEEVQKVLNGSTNTTTA